MLPFLNLKKNWFGNTLSDSLTKEHPDSNFSLNNILLYYILYYILYYTTILYYTKLLYILLYIYYTLLLYYIIHILLYYSPTL
jgi:hypothetical protein